MKLVAFQQDLLEMVKMFGDFNLSTLPPDFVFWSEKLTEEFREKSKPAPEKKNK